MNITQEKRLGKNSRITILGTQIDVLSRQQTVDLVNQYVLTKTGLHLMGVNADKLNATSHNELLKDIVNKCGVINADGASVVLASRFLGKPLPERVAGIDLMQDLVKLSEEKGYSIYLLGAKDKIVKRTADVLKRQYPNLKILGFHDGYFDRDQWENIADLLKKKSPILFLLGLLPQLRNI